MATGSEIERLIVRIEGDLSGLKTSLGKATQEVDRASGTMSGRLGKLAGSFTSVEGAAVAMGGAIGIAAVAVIAGAKVALKYADDLSDTAAALGLNVEKLQEWRFAAEQSGVSSQEMDKSLMRMNLAIGNAIKDGGAAAAKFEKLGISFKDAGGNARNTDAVFTDFAQKLSEMKTAAERSAAAGDILGDKLGPKLNGLLMKGADGLDALKKAAMESGAVISESTIKKAGEAQDKLDALASVTKAQLTVALVELAPVLTTIAEGIALIATDAGIAAVALKAMFGASPVDLDNEIADLNDRIAETQRRLDSEGVMKGNAEAAKFYKQELKNLQGMLDLTQQKQQDLLGAKGAKAGPSSGSSEFVGPPDLNADEKKKAAATAEAARKKELETTQKWLDDLAQRRRDFNVQVGEEDLESHQTYDDLRAEEFRNANEQAEKELAESLERRKVIEQGYNDWRLSSIGLNAQDLAGIDTFETDSAEGKFKTIDTLAQGALSSMSRTSKKSFEVAKKWAIASATINTIVGATNALKDGDSWTAVARAIVIMGYGFAQVAAIRSTQYGGAGGGAVGAGSPSASAGGVGGGGFNSGNGPSQNVYLRGLDANSLYTGRQLIDLINLAQGDGSRIRIVG